MRDGVDRKRVFALVGNINGSYSSAQPPAATQFHGLNLLYHSKWGLVEIRLINISISFMLWFMVDFFAPAISSSDVLAATLAQGRNERAGETRPGEGRLLHSARTEMYSS